MFKKGKIALSPKGCLSSSLMGCLAILLFTSFNQVSLSQELNPLEDVRPLSDLDDQTAPSGRVLENLDSISIDSLEKLFTLYSRTGDEKAANQALDEIIKRDPAKAADLKRYLFLSGPMASRLEAINKLTENLRVVEELEKIREEHFPNSPFLLDVDLAESYGGVGQFDKAIEIYKRVIASPEIYGAEEKTRAEELLHFVDRDRQIYQGYEFLRNRNLDKAKELLVKVDEAWPNDKRVDVYRFDVRLSKEIDWIYDQIRMGNFEEALVRAEQMAGQNQDNTTARRLVSDVNLAIEVEKIYALLTGQKFKQALVEANILAIQLPDDPTVKILLEDAKRTNRFAEVYRYLANPTNANLNLALAEARRLENQFPGDPSVSQLFADINKTKAEGSAYRYANDPRNRSSQVEETVVQSPAPQATTVNYAATTDEDEEEAYEEEVEPHCPICGSEFCQAGSACTLNGSFACDESPFIGSRFGFIDGLEGTGYSIKNEASYYYAPGVAIGVRSDIDFVNLSNRRLIRRADRDLINWQAFAKIDHSSNLFSETRLGSNREGQVTGGATLGFKDCPDGSYFHQLYFDVNADVSDTLHLIAMQATQRRVGAEGTLDLNSNLSFRYDLMAHSVYVDDIQIGSGQRFIAELEQTLWESYEKSDKFAISLFTNIGRFSGKDLTAAQLSNLGVVNTTNPNLGEQFFDSKVSRVGPLLSATFEVSPFWILNIKAGQLYDFADDSDVTKVSIHNEWSVDDRTFIRAGADYLSNGVGLNRGDDVYSGFIYLGRKF